MSRTNWRYRSVRVVNGAAKWPQSALVTPSSKVAGAFATAVVASGVFASAGLGLAPTANATCASFFGIGNSADCTSTLLSVAVAIGNGATAHADGLLGAAFVIGANSSATTTAASIFDLATSVFGDNNPSWQTAA